MGWQVDGDGDQVSPSLCAQCANQYLVQELCKSFIMGSRKLVTTEILMRAIESVPPPRVRHDQFLSVRTVYSTGGDSKRSWGPTTHSIEICQPLPRDGMQRPAAVSAAPRQSVLAEGDPAGFLRPQSPPQSPPPPPPPTATAKDEDASPA